MPRKDACPSCCAGSVGFNRSLDGCFGRMTTDVKRPEQRLRGCAHIPYSLIERGLVGLRRSVKATDLADELERRVVKLMLGGLAIRAAADA